MWLREQKLEAGIGFTAAVVQLLDHLKETQLSDDGPGVNGWRAGCRKHARPSTCSVPSTPSISQMPRALALEHPAHPRQGRPPSRVPRGLDLLRRVTLQLRQEIARAVVVGAPRTSLDNKEPPGR
jgi:hypothetical protein